MLMVLTWGLKGKYVQIIYPSCINQILIEELTCGLIIVNTDPVQLQVTVSMVSPCGINAMLIADHFPELQTEKGKVSHDS